MTATTVRAGAPGETFGATLGRLSGAQKGAKGAPAYSRFVNRRLGRVLAALAFHAGLTPNAVTALSAGCTFPAIALLALLRPTWTTGLLVAALLLVGYALDSADGQLARLRGGGSPAGEWLDHVVDAAKIASLHLALLVGLYRADAGGRDARLLLPLAFSVVATVLFFATLLNDVLRARHGRTPRTAATERPPGVLRSLLVAPTDYGVLCLVFALLGWHQGFAFAYAALLAATTTYLCLALVRWFREMEGLTR